MLRSILMNIIKKTKQNLPPSCTAKSFPSAPSPQRCVVVHVWTTVPTKDFRAVRVRCRKLRNPPTFFQKPSKLSWFPRALQSHNLGSKPLRACCHVTPRWRNFRCQLSLSCCSKWSRRDLLSFRSCVMTSAPSGKRRWLRLAQPEPGARRRTSGRCWWRSVGDRGRSRDVLFTHSSCFEFVHFCCQI